MSFQARVREWMRNNPGAVRSGEIADGLGLCGEARKDVTHALRNLLRDGHVIAEGAYARRTYLLISEPTRERTRSQERRRAMNAACQERYYWQRKGMTVEEGRAQAAAKRARRDAERARLDAARTKRAAERARLAEIRAERDAERAVRAAQAPAIAEARAAARRENDARKKREAEKAQQAADAVKLQQMVRRLRAEAARKPAPAPAVVRPETVAEFQARGGRVEVLPPPTYHHPRTLPEREFPNG